MNLDKSQVRVVTLIFDRPRGCSLVSRFGLVKYAAFSVLAACYQGWTIQFLGNGVTVNADGEEEAEEQRAWSPSMGRAGILASSFCLKVQGTR